jgi:hypothetical protein
MADSEEAVRNPTRTAILVGEPEMVSEPDPEPEPRVRTRTC